MKKVYLDFEFNTTQEKDLNLVCCHLLVQENGKQSFSTGYWLHNSPHAKANLKSLIKELHKQGAVFVAFAAVAESRSIASLGINPVKLKWIDLHFEYKMLTNHNNELAYGKQLIRGQEKNTFPPKPKWMLTEDERRERDMSKAEVSLAACTYKLLGIKLDTDHKKQMRDLIISAPKEFSTDDKKAIQDYCASDVKHLPFLLKQMLRHYRKLTPVELLKKLPGDMLRRGDYAARTALMERTGYPVNVEWVKNFVAQVPTILKDMNEDINSQFSEAPPFKWNNARQAYSMDLKTIRSWMLKDYPADSWMKTETGLLSVSGDSFEQKYHYKHDYPRKNFGAQMLRFFKFKQSLNGFLPKAPNAKNKETFLDSVGPDGFCRPYLNPYGAQSGRSQPKATSFIPLKAAWMRSLISPPKGYFIAALDYSSEEFLLSGLVSRDITMVNAYKSGDPYLYFAKQVGAAPANATKKTHSKIREPFKSTTLGLSYGMMEKSLAAKLTQDTGEEYTEEQAADYISQFFTTYCGYRDWCGENLQAYREKGFIRLPCGWTMYGDNDNPRSINNVVIQGYGSSIMRKAVELAQDRGVNLIFTLHDALYMIGKVGRDESKIDVLWDSMHEGFSHYFSGRARPHAESIRLDGKIWGPDLTDGEFKTQKGRVLKTQKIHIDERAIREYDQFSKYFITAERNKADSNTPRGHHGKSSTAKKTSKESSSIRTKGQSHPTKSEAGIKSSPRRQVPTVKTNARENGQRRLS